jgi:hypothetical protein
MKNLDPYMLAQKSLDERLVEFVKTVPQLSFDEAYAVFISRLPITKQIKKICA